MKTLFRSVPFKPILLVLLCASHLLGQDHPPVGAKLVAPLYPEEMSRRGNGGAVVVEFIISENRNVTQAKALQSSDQVFEAPAVQAVLQWKFKPGEKGGRKTSVRASQLLEFSFDPVPVYPAQLLIEPAEGSATIQFSVDRQGRADQTRIISATRPEFGYAAQAAVESASFGPPLGITALNRPPRQLTLNFAIDRKSDAPVDEWSKSHLDHLKNRHVFPAENTLSKPLVPRLRGEPHFPRGIPVNIRTGTAVVAFVVDREGKVHLPQIVSSSKEEFGFSAVAAVASWTYDPPGADMESDGVIVTKTFEFNRPLESKK